jgi:hypothetical protein
MREGFTWTLKQVVLDNVHDVYPYRSDRCRGKHEMMKIKAPFPNHIFQRPPQ